MTNHAQEAIDLLDELEISELDADEILLAAQVHAQLAVANELHTASLLAFAQFSHETEDRQRLFTKLEYSHTLRAIAGRALGLTGDEVIPE